MDKIVFQLQGTVEIPAGERRFDVDGESKHLKHFVNEMLNGFFRCKADIDVVTVDDAEDAEIDKECKCCGGLH